MVAKIKGMAIKGLVDALLGFAPVVDLDDFVDPSVRSYLERPALVSHWYPEADYRLLLFAVGNMLQALLPKDGPPVDVWETIGEEGAKLDFAGIYKAVVRANDPAGAIRRTGTSWSLYHDSGRITVDVRAGANGGTATVKLHDYPLAETRICKSTSGFLRQTLLLSGAASATAVMTECPLPSVGPVVWEVAWSL